MASCRDPGCPKSLQCPPEAPGGSRMTTSSTAASDWTGRGAAAQPTRAAQRSAGHRSGQPVQSVSTGTWNLLPSHHGTPARTTRSCPTPHAPNSAAPRLDSAACLFFCSPCSAVCCASALVPAGPWPIAFWPADVTAPWAREASRRRDERCVRDTSSKFASQAPITPPLGVSP